MKNLFFIFAVFATFVLSHSLCLANQDDLKVLFLGDSLTEGYGIEKKQSYAEVAIKILQEKGQKVEILNASVSGSTTASALSRLKWFSKKNPQFVFIALGANDILRGIDVSASKENLSKAIEYAKDKKIKVFLAGMLAPPNYGSQYSNDFQKMYGDLGIKYDVPVLPFLLEGVAGEKKYNQEDGIHPNVLGHELMGKNVATFLEKNLK